MLLVGTGVMVGTASAVIAIAPALSERASSLPFVSLGLLLTAVMVTGVLAALGAIRIATSTRLTEALKAE
jgi:hypothetical protein